MAASSPRERLIVAGSTPSCERLSDILLGAGYRVHRVVDAAAAPATARTLLPGLILLDAGSAANGAEVCRQLKADPQTADIPVILLTDRAHGPTAGAADFLAEPWHDEEALARVHTLLELRWLRMELEERVLQRTAELRDAAAALEHELATRRKAEERLRLAGKVYEATFDAIMVTDQRDVIVSVNPSFTRVTGYTPHDALGKRPDILKSDRCDPEFHTRLHKSLEATGSWSGEVWNRRKDGNVVPMMQSISVVWDAQGQVSHYITTLMDLSESKDAQTLIEFLAYHDAVTGLPNRVVARRHFDLAASRIANGGRMIAVMCVDLDRFRVINDSLGHFVGDQVLRMVGERLAQCVDGNGVIARQGGDEFLLVADIADVGVAADLARCMTATAAQELHIEGRRLTVTASIGIALYPNDGTTLEELLRRADNALRAAKILGGSTYSYFIERMDAEAQARVELETSLRDAVARGDFELVYQPKIAMASGALVGAEALLRWHSPVLGFVSPAQFIPVAEETALILSIDAWVLDTVCRQIRRWLDAGMAEVPISVNLSPLQFRHTSLHATVERALRDNAVPARLLDLEITERALIGDIGHAIAVLRDLKTLGVSISLDDFGTGYSSLSYLKRLPIDILKIDKSFVDEIHANRSDAAIALTVLALAHNLGMEVVAEGVELREQYEFLHEHGCDVIQGYYVGRPQPAAEFERLLAELKAKGEGSR